MVYFDVVLKRFFTTFNKILLPLMLPFLLYNSGLAKAFQSKFLGQLDAMRPNVRFNDIAGLGNAKI